MQLEGLFVLKKYTEGRRGSLVNLKEARKHRSRSVPVTSPYRVTFHLLLLLLMQTAVKFVAGVSVALLLIPEVVVAVAAGIIIAAVVDSATGKKSIRTTLAMPGNEAITLGEVVSQEVIVSALPPAPSMDVVRRSDF